MGPVGCRRFILTLVAALAMTASGCADDDVGADGDDGDDDGDDQGTEVDAGDDTPDAGPPDAAPVPDATPETTVSFIGMGNHVSCVVLSTGTVRCWGANEQGQLGNGTYDTPLATPTDVTGLTDADTVDCGTAHCCAHTKADGAQCWGWNAAGELAANQDGGQLFNRNTAGAALEEPPKGEIAAVQGASQVASGGAHNCALKGGQVWCWGWNAAGQGGRDPAVEANLFVAKPNGITGVTRLALAHVVLAEHSCAITQVGEAICWGLDNSGQLGDGAIGPAGPRHTTSVVTGLVGVTALAAGQVHTCAVARLEASPQDDPAVYCWGDNGFGQAGPVNPGATPTAVPGLDGAVELAGGQSHTCARLNTGGVRCWGANNFGQLGNGTDIGGGTPTDVVSPDGKGLLSDVVQIATGFGNSCARTADGRVYCWGLNDLGQLGQGTPGPNSLVPLEVLVLPEE